jgi:hypothetical protein
MVFVELVELVELNLLGLLAGRLFVICCTCCCLQLALDLPKIKNCQFLQIKRNNGTYL